MLVELKVKGANWSIWVNPSHVVSVEPEFDTGDYSNPVEAQHCRVIDVLHDINGRVPAYQFQGTAAEVAAKLNAAEEKSNA